jgi:hypothetical protein
MTRLDDFIKGLDIPVNETRKEEIKDYYKNLYDETKEHLMAINESKESGNDSDLVGWQIFYAMDKAELQGAKLWDEEFNEQYKLALEGRLDSKKLNEIKLE